MRGLLLTNYYLVYRTFFMFMGIAILGAGFVFYFGDASMYRLIATFIILFAAIPALEVIKYESKSGYEKYVLTLPVTRSNIVESHYFFYFLVVIIGTLLSYGIFYVYGLVSGTPIDDGIFKSVSLGTFIILNAGAIAYPLLYVFGAEKSDAITIGGACGGLVIYFGLQSVIGYLIEQFPISNLNESVYVSILYIIFGVIIYTFSFFISVFIYRKKEF
ncbi:ABC-2 transporter permease [Bacillus thuringiensis]|uniref:ABC-2 family transporter protein n=3 Tax=Bacillus cereus group TaxID=86661 RepID=A0ABD5I3F4_BACTU|nr:MULTISPECIES: ABC-2 transporter permease [Bacillus]KAB2377313.1 ABC-2 transporter permease [Bacillus sp. RM2(2019)]MBK5493045.1 ABC-2 transporter permease [Bacillus sp. TH13]MCC6079517.1 ABC-2 transporter permease [Bacillus thuringiensis]MCR6781657.1 ABC-2 transporter permease [Bacillus thuringiensis]MCR6859727.1 ABC-2 transporter permease [Bacillus thuringiensis]